MSRRLLTTTALTVLLCGTLTACGGGSDDAEGTEADAGISFAGAPIAPVDKPAGAFGFPVTATFSPAEEGAPVTIEEKRGGDWKKVASGEQDADGSFTTAVGMDPQDPKTYRAVTETEDGDEVTTGTAKATFRSLAWKDEFDGDRLDPKRWTTKEAYGELRQCAHTDEDLTTVEDGNVVLRIERRMRETADGPRPVTTGKCPHGVYDNAGIQSLTRFGHSVISARIKFQSGGGQHGAFWVQGAGEDSVEMDVAEYFGDPRWHPKRGLQSWIHPAPERADTEEKNGGYQPKAFEIIDGKQKPSNGWHVYAVEWTPDGYVFSIDGVPTLTTDEPYVATSPEQVLFTLFTSDWELKDGPPLDESGQVIEPRSTMRVDWVRVYG
jgi:beta-glucanase (GH16 family)